MYILAKDIQSEDGVANAAILEAAQRLEELYKENIELKLIQLYREKDCTN
jgi:hypothetical protein